MIAILALDGAAISGLAIAVISATVAVISAIISFKGKRVDAGEWLTERLREDAEAVRKRLEVEDEEHQDKLSALQEAVASLQKRETDLMAYVASLESEIKSLKELVLVLQAASPPQDITIKGPGQ